MKNIQLFEEFINSSSLNNINEANETKIPLTPQQMEEFVKLALEGKKEDKSGNGAKNQAALEAADLFARKYKLQMFQNGDWTKPIGVSGPNADCVKKVTDAISKIQKDLEGIGSPIDGLSDDVLHYLKDLTINYDSNKEVEKYNRILNVCMLFNGFNQKTKKDLVSEIGEDIKGDIGEQYLSWLETADHIFGYLGV